MFGQPETRFAVLLPVALVALVHAACPAPGPMPPDATGPDDAGPLDGQQGPAIEIGEIIYGGNGCPMGTAQVTMSADNDAIHMQLDEYVARTDPGSAFARKSCNLAVSIVLPPGVSIAIAGAEQRGHATIPVGAQGSYAAEIFFPGETGPMVRHEFPAGFDSDFELQDEISPPEWSECGAATILRVNSSIIAEKTSPATQQEALVAIEESRFPLRWRECR